jgi:hypothetical protein
MRTRLKIKSSTSLLVTISMVLSACNFSKVQRVEHEGAGPEVSSTKSEKQNSEMAQSIRNKDLSILYKMTASIQTADEARTIIRQLQESLLKSEIIDNPALRNEANVTTALSYYNIATLKLLTLPSSGAANEQETDQEVEAYLQFTTKGCSENLENCSRLNWVRKDPRTSQILTRIAVIRDAQIDPSCKDASCENQLSSLFRVISLSFATSNRNKDIDLYRVFSKRVHQYVAILEKSKNIEQIKQQGVLFDTIVNNLSPEEEEQILLPIVKVRPPWAFSHKTNTSFNFGSEKIFSVASKNLLYEKDQLNSSLKTVILNSQKDPNNTDSYFHTAKKLKEDSSTTQIFKNMNFDVEKFLSDGFYDEYFYMIERLAHSHLNYDEVEAIWKGSKKNLSTLTQKIKDLAQLELVSLVVKTNKYFSVLLQTKNLPSDRLFIKSIEESRPLTDTWNDYFSKLSKVSNLIGQIATNSQFQGNDLKRIESSKDFIMTVKRNSKFMAVYPNMLTLGYFMIKVDAMFKTTTWWGTEISIDPKTIVNYLLDGGFEAPWYMFSGDTTPLNKSEMILAFDYALRLGSFEIFGSAKDDLGNAKIDRLQFFKSLKSTMDSNIKDLTDVIEKMQRVENESESVQVLGICGQKDFKDVTVNMKLEDFEQYALFGDLTRKSIAAAAKFYDASSAYFKVPASSGSRRVYSMRDLLNNRFLQLRAMSVPLIENVKSLNIPEQEKNLLLQKINAELKDVYTKLQQYYVTALNNHQLITDCTQKLVRAERDRQFFLVETEKNYLIKVYEAMTSIRNEADSQKKANLAKSLADQLSTSADILMAANYTYTKYDLYRRFESYSQNKELMVEVKVESPDDSTKNQMQSDIRTIPFIDLQTGAPVSQERFLKTALSYFNNQGMNTVQWFRSSIHTKLSLMKQDSMIAIYKLGFDLGLQRSPIKFKDKILQPIKSQDIVAEAVALARSLSIRSEEEALMRLIGQYELVPFNELQGYLFDTSESDFYGVVDNVFQMTTRVNEDFAEAERYYKERINTRRTDAMIFPMDETIENQIHRIYHFLVKKNESLVHDFIKGVRDVQTEVEKNPLQIVYRLLEDGSGKLTYSSEKIKGMNSILVDERKIKSLFDTIHDFHNRVTFRVYEGALNEENQ